jgi:hypothetical protein
MLIRGPQGSLVVGTLQFSCVRYFENIKSIRHTTCADTAFETDHSWTPSLHDLT